MRQIDLSIPPNFTPCVAGPIPLNYFQLVKNELYKIQRRFGKVYRTKVGGIGIASKNCVFVTTSKDIHLFFGSMSLPGQQYLALMLEEEFANGSFREIMIRYSTDKAVLVTDIAETEALVFNFAPAN